MVPMTILSAIGDIRRFGSPKKLVGDAGLGAGVHDSREKHQDKGITKFGRRELRWALVEASWQAVRSNPHLRAELAYKMLSWAWHMDKTALNGMTNQQLAKYVLLRLGKGEYLTRIVRGGSAHTNTD